jgi:uncharacterized protein (TIGR02271 family)
MRDSQAGAPVIGQNGLSGVLVDPLPSRRTPDDTVRINLSSGRVIEVPADMLVPGSDGTYWIPMGPEDVKSANLQSGSVPRTSRSPEAAHRTEENVVPVVAEELVIDKKRVQTGAIRVNRRIIEHDETIELPLVKEHLDVRRVVIDREVDGPLPIRREGDTTIIPIVEEVLVVEKRYRLKEEIFVSRTVREEVHREQVTVRRQEAQIEHLDKEGRPHSVTAESPARERRRRPRKSILGED